METGERGFIRVLILEQHTLVRYGLKLIFEQCADMSVVGETSDANEALVLVSTRQPDIILLSTNMNGNLFLDLIPELLDARPEVSIILLDECEESPWQLQAVQNGVMGIVLKSQSPDVLVKAVRKVHAGEAWIERTKIASLLTLISRTRSFASPEPHLDRISQLSKRERQVVKLVAQMMKNQQIAATLNISDVTVRHHLTSIYSKLEVSGRLELLVFAHRYGLVEKSAGENGGKNARNNTFVPF